MIQESTLEQALKDLFAHIQFQSEPEGLYDPLRYMIALGGKRIRPRLCLLTYGIFREDLGPWLLEPAAGLEVFHTFTLIHDDIMDRSALRRGSQTVWKKNRNRPERVSEQIGTRQSSGIRTDSPPSGNCSPQFHISSFF